MPTTEPNAAPSVLVPWVVPNPPDGLVVASYDGDSEPPQDLSAVELYVMPYNNRGAADLIPRLSALKTIQLLTAGYEHVEAVLPAGVRLHNGAGLHDATTSELAVALMLAAQRNLSQWTLNQQAHVWDRVFTRSLADSRVLIVGYGNIGKAIEARLQPFEVTITKVAHRARPEQDVHAISDLPHLLPQADIVVLVLPDTPQTRGLMGAAQLALLPDDALVINVGRGTALDTDALVAEKGRIRAGLDVQDPEPVPAGHPLWDVPGVILTPHIGGGTSAFLPRAKTFVDEQLVRWAAGDALENLVATGE